MTMVVSTKVNLETLSTLREDECSYEFITANCEWEGSPIQPWHSHDSSEPRLQSETMK